ncbi:glycosyltransferase family 9 protein [Legionella sp. 29fVS95]|uniref:glycosyltransferase family 9 protein n=1 Tax=Legionella sp. 29fVS95 TaxID=3402813 RepID=UPI003AF940B9
MKILVIQHKAIGDVLVGSILCDNLRRGLPTAKIDYLIHEATESVLRGNKSIDRLVLFRRKHRKSKIEFLKLAFAIRKQNYDLIIDAYSKLESWIIVLLSGANRRISHKKRARNFLYTDPVPFARFSHPHLGVIIQKKLSLLNPLSLNIDLDPVPKIFLTPNERKKAEELFIKHEVKITRKTIMVSLLGSSARKTYPLDYMLVLINEIAKNYDVNILFNYLPQQASQASYVYNGCTKTTKVKLSFNLIGQDLREFIIIMDQCDLIVGNEGGAVNIAKALNKPSFSIFSPAISKKDWATFEDGIRNVSISMEDFKPELINNKSYRRLKQESLQLYEHYLPELIIPKLHTFLQRHLEILTDSLSQ